MTPDWIGTFFGILADSSLRAFVVAAIVALVLLLLRVQSSSVRHAAWSSVMAAMLLMPAMPSIVPTFEIPVGVPAVVSPLSREMVPIGPEPELAVGGSVEGNRQRSNIVAIPGMRDRSDRLQSSSLTPRPLWHLVALLTYATGALVLLCRLVIGWRRALKISRISQPTGHDAVYESTLVAVPLTIGVMSPRIVLPTAWRLWPQEKLLAVLAHERAHIQRRDPLISVLAHVNHCVFWFHPLAWWLERKLAMTAEHACDDAAVRAVGQARRYAEVLLDMAQAVRRRGRRVAWQGIGVDGNGLLGRRIDRILRRDRLREMSRTRKAIVALCCIAAIAIVVSCRQRMTAAPLREDPEFSRLRAEQKARADAARAARELSPQEAEQLEALVKANPEDLESRRRLLAFYGPDVSGKPRNDEAKVIAARRPHVLWLIAHHPEHELAGSLNARIYPTTRDWLADPVGYAQGMRLWLAHAARKDVRARELGHAAWFLEAANKPLAEEMLLQAQAIEKTERWSSRLGTLYYEVLVGSNAATLGGAIRSIRLADAHGPYASKIRQKLTETQDAQLLATTATSLIRSPHDPASPHSPKTPRVDFSTFDLGRSYLERAAKLAPDATLVRSGLLTLASVEESQRMRALTGGSIPRPAQAEALAKLSESVRLGQLPGLAETAYMWAEHLGYTEKDEAGALESYRYSRQYAQDTLTIAPSFKADSRYRSAVFRATIVLATHSLREGDGRTAVRYMREAMEVGADSTYDPGHLWMRLAAYLLKHGERDSIVQFLEHLGQIHPRNNASYEKSAAAIRAGMMPGFYQATAGAR